MDEWGLAENHLHAHLGGVVHPLLPPGARKELPHCHGSEGPSTGAAEGEGAERPHAPKEPPHAVDPIDARDLTEGEPSACDAARNGQTPTITFIFETLG